jgi:hypothetical protein
MMREEVGMGAKVYADRLSPEADLIDGLVDGLEAVPEQELELETEVQAVAAWFDALPDEWQRYFDLEAQSGRRAYGQA